ncbi:hypothetical protein CR152_15800 [Massilia violaceinigra]|uniref:Uncharacterized protein n=1 Tax=Massilia violaceinigra TaxID=2045208 RepID=A0A2D2DLH1_9BURK|nr:hypothetical protein CR152_15800 [Massilia violaceinigra]
MAVILRETPTFAVSCEDFMSLIIVNQTILSPMLSHMLAIAMSMRSTQMMESDIDIWASSSSLVLRIRHF